MGVQFGDHWQVLVDQIAELVVVLVEVQDHKGVRVCLCDLANVLISRNLDHLAVLFFLGLELQLLHAARHVLPGELIIEVEVVLELVDLFDRHLIELVLKLALLLVLFQHDLLLFCEGGLLFVGQVVAMLDLQVKPFC